MSKWKTISAQGLPASCKRQRCLRLCSRKVTAFPPKCAVIRAAGFRAIMDEAAAASHRKTLLTLHWKILSSHYSAWKIFSLEPSVLFALILKIIRFLSSGHPCVWSTVSLLHSKCNTRTPGTDDFIALFFHGSDKMPDESNLSLEGFFWAQSLKVLSTVAGKALAARAWDRWPHHVCSKEEETKDVAS